FVYGEDENYYAPPGSPTLHYHGNFFHSTGQFGKSLRSRGINHNESTDGGGGVSAQLRPGICIVSEACCCSCHKNSAMYVVSKYLHRTISSSATVFSCRRIGGAGRGPSSCRRRSVNIGYLRVKGAGGGHHRSATGAVSHKFSDMMMLIDGDPKYETDIYNM